MAPILYFDIPTKYYLSLFAKKVETIDADGFISLVAPDKYCNIYDFIKTLKNTSIQSVRFELTNGTDELEITHTVETLNDILKNTYGDMNATFDYIRYFVKFHQLVVCHPQGKRFIVQSIYNPNSKEYNLGLVIDNYGGAICMSIDDMMIVGKNVQIFQEHGLLPKFDTSFVMFVCEKCENEMDDIMNDDEGCETEM